MSAIGTRLTIANLPLDISEKDLHDMFNSAGAIISANLIKNNEGKGTGEALIIYAHTEGAQLALKQFNNRTIHNSRIVIKPELPPYSSQVAQRPTFRKPEPFQKDAPIPIFASPIMMFNPETGLPYAEGEAPSIWSLLFPSLTSARWVDPHVDIYVITNFVPHPKDMAEMQRLNIQVLDSEECFAFGRVASIFESFQSSCPIGGKDLGGSGIIGVTRFFAVQGAMEMLGLDMVFFFEGDNLLTRPIDYIAKQYQIRENKIDATITHISFHASFIGLEFLEQLNNQAALFGAFTKNHVTNACFLTGGGQDMRLGYEGAKMLQVQKYMFNNVQGQLDEDENDARIMNTAGGTVPCDVKPRRWNNALGEYCRASKEEFGPCALEPNLEIFNKNNGEMWTSKEDAFLPLLFECDPRSMQPSLTNDIDKIPGSLQQNLKGRNVKQSPGSCGPNESYLCEPSFSDNVHISQTFYCDEDWVKSDPEEQNNKAVSFKYGRAFSVTPTGHWVEHYNLHFQGGGCKKQMEVVFAALERSTRQGDEGFTCEEMTNLADHEECLRTGTGAVASMSDYIKYE
eukprot:CAMPEP_0114349964 /NCGR_PEP_ID=MMETSP0101-20121206/15961_1 /TAXON_ID=38822 ORGANISM="Pteridomonas danica, Strain PT" /NCGR_SAMPLE_ID=MMETSP0101 /ASSEMBLY_ACC=CAM_ASM_000211 /LENGTH=568 /DNA_ID=CAMNT_0001488869 /DNA_START=375 /DNA_END=2081 /DNA_ORIENTATION=+